MHELAERLCMTVGELGDRMTWAEFQDWNALDEIRAAEREKAQRLAKQGMRAR